MSHRRKQKDEKKENVKSTISALMKKKKCIFNQDKECELEYLCKKCEYAKGLYKRTIKKSRAKKIGRMKIKEESNVSKLQ